MCCGKAFHLILMHFISYIQCFEECFQKSGCFSPKFYFCIFSIDPICFQSIKIYFKILCEPLSVSIDRNCFSINRISWIRFFLKKILTFSNSLFQKFLSFSLSLQFGRSSTSYFCHFLSFFLQGFSLQIPVRLFYPSFCFYFDISCNFSCILIWGFRTYTYLGFVMIKAIFSEIDL